MSRPGVAAVLSFVLPGLGQLYNGHFIRAGFWLLVTPAPMIGLEHGFWGWACHIIAAMTAYAKASQLEYFLSFRAPPPPPPGGGRVFDQ